jgi:hypothetical protein
MTTAFAFFALGFLKSAANVGEWGTDYEQFTLSAISSVQ